MLDVEQAVGAAIGEVEPRSDRGMDVFGDGGPVEGVVGHRGRVEVDELLCAADGEGQDPELTLGDDPEHLLGLGGGAGGVLAVLRVPVRVVSLEEGVRQVAQGGKRLAGE